MYSSGFEYFNDYWNCIDFASLLMNTSFLANFSMCMCFQNEFISKYTIRTFGAFSCFFMWIKVFYWMRLFSALAYYVKLIQQTIADASAFMMMVFIILAAFANFIYVENTNLVHE